MRRDKDEENYKPFKMGKLTSDFLFDEDGRQRKIKQHHKRGRGTGFIRKLAIAGLLLAGLALFPVSTVDDTKQVFNDGVFDIPPTEQVSINLPLNDPLFTQQWHLQNTGQNGGTPGMDINVVPAWQDYTGKGHSISVFELYDAIITHPELNGHITLFGGTDVPKTDIDKYHATNVANLAAGRANNHAGGVGVAPNASVTSYGGTTLEHFRAQKDYDVVNASWMYVNFFANNQLDSNGREADWYKALQSTIEEGRNGLGTIWMVAAGNDFLRGHNTNYSGFANNRFVNVIAAIDKNGHILNASSPGASIIASAPGHDIVMPAATLEGADGKQVNSTGSGTSYATPQGSGVECLVLEANPYLGYRDARMILALSSRQVDKGHATWMFNHASNWNGGRMHVSDRFGYGLIDAHAMTRLAETWNMTSRLDNEANIGRADNQGFDIPDSGSITRYIDLSDKDAIDLTDAQLRIKLKHPRMGDLLVELVSPSGTVSKLVSLPEHGKFTGHTDSAGKFTAFDEMDYVFGSVQFMGEKANGRWQIRITDAGKGETGHVELMDLQLYGNQHTNNDRYVFTDEYGELGKEFLRRALTDTDGGRDQLNASPVTSDSKINLEGGESEIAGQKINIAADVIEDVALGDGNDSITGSARADNSFLPGRGDDVTDARGGKNDYFYRDGDGADTYTPSPAGQDRIYLLRGISPDSTMLVRKGNGLMITFKEKPGSIYLGDYFTPGTQHKISTISYPDGSFLRMTGSVNAHITETPQSVADIGTQKGKVPTMPLGPKEKPKTILQRIISAFS